MCCAASLRRETYARERTRVSERERESAREGGGTRARENERDKERSDKGDLFWDLNLRDRNQV